MLVSHKPPNLPSKFSGLLIFLIFFIIERAESRCGREGEFLGEWEGEVGFQGERDFRGVGWEVYAFDMCS